MGDDETKRVLDRRVRVVRRWTVVAASVIYLLLLALIVVVWPVSLDSVDAREVVVGPWTGEVIVTGSIAAAIVSLAVIVFAVPARRWWWLLLGPLRAIAIGAMALGGLAFSLTDDSVTPIVANGCETGYVVTERSFLFAASGSVRRLDGLIGTSVGRTEVDDGHKPFQQQSYIAVTEGDTLRVWNTFQSVGERLSTSSPPSFVLPRLVTETSCGLAGGIDADEQPLPVPTVSADPDEGPAPAPATDARTEVARMVQRTLDAAGGTVTDAEGAPLSAPLASDLPCDGTTAYDLAIRTDDNAASYEAILAAWDAEGYAKDRAMQEDLRCNGVMRLSARDRSSIDGLLHFSLTAECRAP
ncbi:hypothetical protein QE418_003080 [Microbacterium testaceum]|uniref:hypothetical protein n=1 Tax=Microbacterium TaxID=33882 RepID=UPI002787A0CB|nr:MULTISPECIES: hypothetical protein [Microbacterium]MDQ1113632.1 hypothetical protein [Microbacterium testaceum]MDR6099266.1 hypothetical protein [Microbacterium sp. SORGH_AS_0454]